jgi:hypothetical protein
MRHNIMITGRPARARPPPTAHTLQHNADDTVNDARSERGAVLACRAGQPLTSIAAWCSRPLAPFKVG